MRCDRSQPNSGNVLPLFLPTSRCRDVWFAKVNRRERRASKILRGSLYPQTKQFRRRKPHLHRCELRQFVRRVNRNCCDRRNALVHFVLGKQLRVALQQPAADSRKEKRRAFGVANHTKVVFIREGEERGNSSQSSAGRRLEADGRGNGDTRSSIGTGAKTSHDCFRPAMFANDFIKRFKKWSGTSAIVRPIARAQNFFFVGQRDRAAASGQIEGEQFHPKLERSMRR